MNCVFEVEPFDPATVTEADVGRTVIYVDFDGTGEAGTLSSWSPNKATFWARFSTGSTAAGCGVSDLVWGVKQLELI
ncbi:hypothetical protein EVC26_079 [Rhizobium phage RHph_I72]|nr:hypothetical protein EVC13_077 [Rhizobium phage RHph_I65]QIG76525.1 hypothetical protein EVC26_079 [Rhizobium phage RHph_I72]